MVQVQGNIHTKFLTLGYYTGAWENKYLVHGVSTGLLRSFVANDGAIDDFGGTSGGRCYPSRGLCTMGCGASVRIGPTIVWRYLRLSSATSHEIQIVSPLFEFSFKGSMLVDSIIPGRASTTPACCFISRLASLWPWKRSGSAPAPSTSEVGSFTWQRVSEKYFAHI